MSEEEPRSTGSKVAISFVGLIVLAVGWFFSAYPRGMLVAWADGLRGHDEVKTFGLRQAWAWDADRLLGERHGIRTDVVAGCVVSPDVGWYADGYNAVARPRILARAGKDVFAECRIEAETAWRAEHSMQPRPQSAAPAKR